MSFLPTTAAVFRLAILNMTLVSFAAESAVAIPPAGASDEFQFRVLLDDREIGFHRYSLVNEDGRLRVQSEAAFDVKILFFNAYSYRHELTAEWNNGCLRAIAADTDANGKRLSVSGDQRDGEFIVRVGGADDALPGCVKNFAYWDREILNADKLLNPQTGEYLDVAVETLGEAEISIDGVALSALAYRLIAKGMRIDLWYAADDGRWLALESPAKGGRTLRYERS